MDELIAWAAVTKLFLRVAKNNLPSVEEQKTHSSECKRYWWYESRRILHQITSQLLFISLECYPQSFLTFTNLQVEWNKLKWKTNKEQKFLHTWLIVVYLSYFESHAVGVKSSLCLVLKKQLLVRTSSMDGGCRGQARANRASWGRTGFPSAVLSFCPYKNFKRPWKFMAYKNTRHIFNTFEPM